MKMRFFRPVVAPDLGTHDAAVTACILELQLGHKILDGADGARDPNVRREARGRAQSALDSAMHYLKRLDPKAEKKAQIESLRRSLLSRLRTPV